MNYQSLKEYANNLFTNIRSLLSRLFISEKVEDDVAEVMRMAVGVSQLVGDGT